MDCQNLGFQELYWTKLRRLSWTRVVLTAVLCFTLAKIEKRRTLGVKELSKWVKVFHFDKYFALRPICGILVSSNEVKMNWEVWRRQTNVLFLSLCDICRQLESLFLFFFNYSAPFRYLRSSFWQSSEARKCNYRLTFTGNVLRSLSLKQLIHLSRCKKTPNNQVWVFVCNPSRQAGEKKPHEHFHMLAREVELSVFSWETCGGSRRHLWICWHFFRFTCHHPV